MYTLTKETRTGSEIIFQSQDCLKAANYLFDEGYYKQSIAMDNFINFHTPNAILTGKTINAWLEEQLPQRTGIVLKQEEFQKTRLGYYMLKFKFLSPWYRDYQENKKTKKYSIK